MEPIQIKEQSAMHKEISLTGEALRLHQEALVFDGHNDMPENILDQDLHTRPDFSLDEPQPKLHTDIPRLRQGGVDAQVFAAYVSPDYIERGGGNQACLTLIELVHSLVKQHHETLELALTASQVRDISERGKIAALIGVEGGHAMEDELKNLERYRELGAIYMTITHNKTTGWADAANDAPVHGGLSSFGREVIRAMNRLGMLVDVSHASDDALRDVLEVSQAPVIASHSSAWALCPHRRNLRDELIRSIAGTGGIVGVNFYTPFLVPEDEINKQQSADPVSYVGHVADHIDHLVKVGGIDHVGLGSDYDGIPYGPKQMPDVSGFPYVTQELMNRGYSTGDIKKILGENFLRVLSDAGN